MCRPLSTPARWPVRRPSRPCWGNWRGWRACWVPAASCLGWRIAGWWCREGSVREYWAIYRALAGAYVSSRLQYRLSFWLGVFVTVIIDLVPLLLIGVVFTRF